MPTSTSSLAAIAVVRVFLGVLLLWHAAGDAMVRVTLDPTESARAATLGLVRAQALPSASLELTGIAAQSGVAPTQPGSQPHALPEVRRVHLRTLGLAEAAGAFPASGTDQTVSDSFNAGADGSVLPGAFASAPWPALGAWLSWVLQILAGAGLLVGLLTRFASGIAFVLIACWGWVAAIGPATMGNAGPLLPRGSLFDLGLWAPTIVGTALVVGVLATLLGGSGLFGVDHIMAGETDEYEPDDE